MPFRHLPNGPRRPRWGERRPKPLTKLELVVFWALMAALVLWSAYSFVHALAIYITRTAHGG